MTLDTIVILLLAMGIMAIAVLLLCIRLFLTRGKESFPHTHIDGNKALQQKGIRCAHHDLNKEYNKLTLLDLMNQDKI